MGLCSKVAGVIYLPGSFFLFFLSLSFSILYSLGIGVESGCELAFRIVERKLDRDGGAVSCEDEECAFNSMDRNIIFAAVFEATPVALPVSSCRRWVSTSRVSRMAQADALATRSAL